MPGPLTLLFAARDVNAARNLAPVAALAGHGHTVRLAAQRPALEIFRQAFPEVLAVDDGPDAAREAAGAWLREISPDAVIVGVSGPEPGLDEALLAARPEGVPGFVFQDFWGDVNPGYRPRGETFLVPDACAARVTAARTPSPCAVAGWPKYDAYAELDPPALRRAAREILGLGAQRLAGFFGQPLDGLPGYPASAAAAARDTAAAWPEAVFLHRPHPRETPEQARTVRAALAAAGRPVLDGPALSAEAALCACDLILTPFSSCGLDALHLSRVSPAPLGAVLYLGLEHDVVAHFRAYTGLDALPPATAGLALMADSEQEAFRLIAGLDAEALHGLWQAARQSLGRPGGAARQTLDAITARCAVR